MEQKSIGYIFPGDIAKHKAAQLKSATEESSSGSSSMTTTSSSKVAHSAKPADDDWQIVFPLKTVKDELSDRTTLMHTSGSTSAAAAEVSIESESDIDDKKPEEAAGILPAARARLVSLRELGAKKIGALKMKLAENKMKSSDKGIRIFCFLSAQLLSFFVPSDRTIEQLSGFAIMDIPSMLPEILTTPSGPFFIVQFLKHTYLLSALHLFSDTLSVNTILFLFFIYFAK